MYANISLIIIKVVAVIIKYFAGILMSVLLIKFAVNSAIAGNKGKIYKGSLLLTMQNIINGSKIIEDRKYILLSIKDFLIFIFIQ